MKSKGFIIAIIVAAIAACTGGYSIKAFQRYANRHYGEQMSQMSEEEARLRAGLDDVRGLYFSESLKLDTSVTDPLNPTYLVQKLTDLASGELSQRNICHQAFYCLQGLSEAGTNAIPAMRSYFISGIDTPLEVSYTVASGKSSVRKELAKMLLNMKTLDATALLSQLIPVTLSPSELSNLIDILLEIDSGLYKPHCINAVRNMYRARSEKNDWKGKERNELYSVLFRKLQDSEFMDTLLNEGAYFDKAGKLDADLLHHAHYLIGEDVIAWCHKAYFDPRMSKDSFLLADLGGGGSFITLVNDYVGSNTLANEIFLESIRRANHPLEKYGSIMNLLNNRGPNAWVGNKDQYTPPPNDPSLSEEENKSRTQEWRDAQTKRQNEYRQNLAQSRLGLLDTLATEYSNDTKMQKVVTAMRKQLEFDADPDRDPEAERPDVDELEILQLITEE